MFIVGKHKLYLHALRNRPEKLTRCIYLHVSKARITISVVYILEIYIYDNESNEPKTLLKVEIVTDIIASTNTNVSSIEQHELVTNITIIVGSGVPYTVLIQYY